MVLTIINQGQDSKLYLSGTVSVPNNSAYTATATQIFPLSRDSGLIFDCNNGNVNLTDGINIYAGSDATDYLNDVASALGGAVVGFVGAPSPSFAITVGGKDPNGNTSVGNFDLNGRLLVNISDGNSNPLTSTTVGAKQAIDVNIAQNMPPRVAQSPAAPTFATVTASSAQVLASNSSRTGLVLINTSKNTISFGLGATAVLNSGITLVPGASWTMDSFTFTTTAINAISSTSSNNLSIQEFS